VRPPGRAWVMGLTKPLGGNSTLRMRTTKRRLLAGALAFAAVSVGIGASVMPASADQRTLIVTLATGQQITVTVDVPPGTPVDQIKIPGVSAGIVSVQDVTAPSQPGAPPASVQVTPTQQQPPPPATPEQPSPAPSSGSQGQQQAQKTTGKAHRKVRPHVQGVAGAVKQLASGAARKAKKKAAARALDGAPTPANPTFSLALPGPAPIGVPNFFIDKFRIPPFLLSIYQAAGIEYGVRWEVLAAINEIETDYGRNLNVSTAGAVGWMQFLPSTWRRWGVDANRDHQKDPYNPVDAIFSAARYLKAAGADTDLRKAIFSYNHADWYVDSVLLRARLLGGLPADFVGSLTGLTEGHFPVHGKATYADDLSERAALKRIKKGQNAAVPVEARSNRRSLNIYSKPGTPVIAVQDGKIVRMGTNKRLGQFLQLQDAYGNTYTYGHLAKIATEYPVPRPAKVSQAQVAKELKLPKKDAAPTAPATAGRQVAPAPKVTAAPTVTKQLVPKVDVNKERLWANPNRPDVFKSGGRKQILDLGGAVSGITTFKSYFTGVFGLKRKDVVLKRLKPGSKVIAGTILGRIGKLGSVAAPHMMFEIRPAGRGAPRIDPKPILDGWKLLESTAIYRAAGMNPFYGRDAKSPSVGQVLLMSKEALQRRVLDDPNVDIYDCGRRDIEAGSIDRRVLATLEFLSASGLKPTVTSLECGHGEMTSSGNVSEHSTGDAVDIAKVNGIPILGHQGPGSITDIAVRRLLTLQGVMKPHQIITLMAYPNADNTLALPDHNDHIHVGFRPMTGAGAQKFDSVLKPGQWDKLIARLGTLENPTVSLQPSKFAVPVRASTAHAGE
jgi:transglycosylase-like protein with SLT domain/peptidase M23-like protein